MSRLFFTTSICLALASAAPGQENDPPTSLMERGAQQFLEGLLQEMEPALDGMMDFVEQMGPAMRQLLDEVQDWSVYEPPEVLPNGDIIIRRKPEPEPEKADPQQQIEL